MSVCSNLHNPDSLLHMSASELENIGSGNLYQFIPFSARPLYALANQVNVGSLSSNVKCVLTPKPEGCDQDQTDEPVDDTGKEDEGSEQNTSKGTDGKEQESGKDGGGTEGNGQECGKDGGPTSACYGHQGGEGTGGNGGPGSWDGFQNYLLYLLTEQRKAGSAENMKLLEANNELRAEIQAFRVDAVERIHQVERFVTKFAFTIMVALYCLLVTILQFILSLTPTGKALKERIKKFLGDETVE